MCSSDLKYYGSIDAGEGDPENAVEYFKVKLIEAIQSMSV